MNNSRWFLVLPLMAALPLFAQPASLVRDGVLKAEPFADAKVVATVKAKQKVDVSERKGGWYKAKTSDGKTGWLRLTSVLLGTGQAKGDSGVTTTAQFLQSGRSGSSGVTAATGIRGLDSADVVNSKPDTAAVAKLDGMNISQDERRKFAADEKLTPQKIDYLPAEGK